MTALASFIKRPQNMSYDGEDDDENILYLLRRSHWTNVGWVLGLTVMTFVPFWLGPFLLNLEFGGQKLLGAGYITMLTFSWYLAVSGLFLLKFFNWYFNVYIITDKKIIDFDFYGLTYKNISDTLITNVQDVTAKISGPAHMVFNIGDVFVQTAGENREFDFSDIDDPGHVRDIISDLAAEVKHRYPQEPYAAS